MGLLNKIFPGQNEYAVPALTVTKVVFPSEERQRQAEAVRQKAEEFKRKTDRLKASAEQATKSMTAFAQVFGSPCEHEFRKGTTHALCEIPKDHAGPHLYKKVVLDKYGNETTQTVWFNGKET